MLLQFVPRQPPRLPLVVHPRTHFERHRVLARQPPSCRGDVLSQQFDRPLAAEAVRRDALQEHLRRAVAEQVDCEPRLQPALVLELLLVNATDQTDPEQQVLNVRRQSARGGGVERNLQVGVGDEPVTGPQAAEEQFEVRVAQPEHTGRDELLCRLLAEDTEAFGPPKRARPRRRREDRDAAGLALGLRLESRISAGVRLDLVSAAVGPCVHFRDGVREPADRAREVVDHPPVVAEEVQRTRVAGVALRQQPGERDEFVPRPRLGRRNREPARRGDAVTGLQAAEVRPAVERAERVVRGRRDLLAEFRREPVDPLAAVPHHIRHRPRMEFAVLAESVNGERAARLEQFAHGDDFACRGIDHFCLCDHTLVEPVAPELHDQLEDLRRLVGGPRRAPSPRRRSRPSGRR